MLITVLGVITGAQLLGSPKTKMVTFEDETGKKEYVEQYKEKYRKTLTLFVYENKSNDTSLDCIWSWIMYAISWDFDELSYRVTYLKRKNIKISQLKNLT